MALSSHALTTLATLRGELGKTGDGYDARLERCINAASEAIEQYAGGRHFEYTASIVERVRGTGSYRLVMERTPIVSVASIVELTQAGEIAQTFDATTYEIEDTQAGFIYREAGWPWTARDADSADPSLRAFTERASVRVTYTGGWVTPAQATSSLARTLPYDLEEACIITAVAIWSRSGYDRNVASSGTDNGPTTTFRTPSAEEGILPTEAAAIVRRYRRQA